ncbi:unnamed protein product [Mytilus edulis]|uniref:EGF-like domain-containing protein n=1 Tax=Mytilus edulis TaxID=6550 RepID=A0A8S3QUY6_MYTED|nr:unnamed protein product [Mytilus edulis]
MPRIGRRRNGNGRARVPVVEAQPPERRRGRRNRAVAAPGIQDVGAVVGEVQAPLPLPIQAPLPIERQPALQGPVTPALNGFILLFFATFLSLFDSIECGRTSQWDKCGCRWLEWQAWETCNKECNGERNRYREVWLYSHEPGCVFSYYTCATNDMGIDFSRCNTFCHNGGTSNSYSCSCVTGFHGDCCGFRVSQLEYRRMVNAEIDVIFRCIECMPAEPDVAPEPEPEPEAEPEAAPEPEPEAVIPDQSFNISLAIEEVEEIVESDIEDPELPDNVVGNLPVTYHIEEQGSKRRFKKLVSSDGFAYTVKRSSTTVTHWRCSVRSKSLWCKATVAQRGGMFIPGVIQHVHPCDPGLTKKTVVRAKALKQQKNSRMYPAGDIVDTAMEVVSDDDFNLPNPGYVERSVNRLREKLRPEEPKDLTFEGQASHHVCHTRTAATTLNCKEVVPGWYIQSSEEAFLPDVLYPCLHPERQLYEADTSTLRLDVSQREERLQSSESLVSCKVSRFPTPTSKGCAFHWGQAVMRKVASNGLKTAYSADKAVNVFIKKVLALPYLPAGHIIPAYRQLTVPPTASPLLHQLMNYINRAWLQCSVWSVAQWSVYQLSIRTNNDVEGWHRRFNGKANGKKLHFYKIVPALIKEAKTVSRQVRLVDEQSLARWQRTKYQRSQGRLSTLWEQLTAGTITTSFFLRAVGHMYDIPVPDPEPEEDTDSD